MLALTAVGLFVVGLALPSSKPAVAAAGINKTINFQGRLLNNAGAVVADGTYNMEFQIWQGGNGCVTGCTSANAYTNNGGTLMWTEDWLYGTNSPDNRVVVKNGYFSVSLGSICPVASPVACASNTGNSQTNSVVDFNQDTLWLSMNVGNTVSTGSTSFAVAGGDGYMIPFKRMASAVYALQAGSCTTCMLQAPTSTAQNTITPQVNGVVGLTVNGTSGTAATAISIVQTGVASALSISQTSNPGAGQALLFVNNTNGAPSGNLIDLQASSVSKFSVTAAGALTSKGGNFEIDDAGVADSTAVRLFSNGGNLYLQNGSGNSIIFRGKTGVQTASIDNTGNLLTAGNLTVQGTGASTIGGTLAVTGTVTTAAGGAAGTGTQLLASNSYIQSRGMNLITNGSGLLGNNYNFSSFTFDQINTHGGKGSFKNNTFSASVMSDEFTPVDGTRTYKFSLWADSTIHAAGSHEYFGVAPYDIDGNSIDTQSYMKFSGSTDTTLALDLHNGDPIAYLTNATGWNNSGAPHQRNFVWYGYANSFGYVYPDYTYSRNRSSQLSDYGANGAWGAGGVSGNQVALRGGWAGPTILAGTAVRNSQSGGTYKYIAASNVDVPNAWTNYTGTIGGWDTTGSGGSNTFPYGTAYLKPLFLMNRDVAGNTTNVSDLWLSELTSANIEVATTTLQGVVSTTTQSFAGDKTFTGSVSTSTLTTASGNLTIDPVGDTIVKGSTSVTGTAALDIQNSTASILYARNDGNIGIGTTAPSSRLDVQGTQSTATLGANLLTNGDFATNSCASWTGGPSCPTGWAAATGAAAHTAGTTPLTQSITVATGTTYQIDYTQSGAANGSLTLAIGSQSQTFPFSRSTHRSIVATDLGATQTFSITPSSNYDGTLDNITIKPITGIALAVQNILNSDGTVGIQMRSGGSGFYNSFIGVGSGQWNTTGTYDTAYGADALYFNTTGDYNSASGTAALLKNTTGSYNTASGAYALYSNDNGDFNVATGSSALQSNLTGTRNTATGTSAQFFNTTGSNNTANGTNSLLYNQTGSGNTALGFQAGFGVWNNSFSNNSLFGYSAGSGLSTGSNNILLGYSAGANLTSGANNVILGYGINAPSATGSNQLNIGNVLTGDTSTGAASFSNTVTVAGDVQTSGNVGFSGTGNTSEAIRKNMIVTAAVNANDVVIIDSANAGQVTTTNVAGSNKVFGVASSTQASTGQTQYIATTGVVQVNADAVAISIGDFMSTSGTTGLATKVGATPVMGSILGRALSSKGASTGLVWVSLSNGNGGGGSDNLQSVYNNSNPSTMVLNTTNGSLQVRDGSPVLTGDLFDVQNNTGTISYFGSSATGMTLQRAASTTALSFVFSTGELRVYDTAATGNYAVVSYSSNKATFAASSGITQIGASGGNVNISLTGQNDALNFTKTYTPAATYSNNDFTITRNLTAAAYTAGGSVLKLEDLSTGSVVQPSVLLINQSNSATSGYLLRAQTASVDKLTVNTTGDLALSGGASISGSVTIGAGQSYTGLGAVTVSAAAATALTLTSNAAATWGTSAGNLTVVASQGGAFLNLDAGTGGSGGTVQLGYSTATTINIGNSTGATAVAINCGTGATACQLGTNAIAHTTIVGTTTGAGATTLQAGTGDLNITTLGTGQLNIGNNAVAQDINIGNSTGATAVNLYGGSGNIGMQGINSIAALGSELITITDFTNAAWTKTGWTVTSTTATHNTGNVSALSTSQVTVTAGSTYKVTYTVTGTPPAEMVVTPNIGGTDGQKTMGVPATAETQLITATTTGALTFTPYSTWTGVISNVSVKLVATATNTVLAVNNSDATVGLEVRPGGSGLLNSFIGVSSGQFNITGNGNAAVGAYALQSNTTGTLNSAIGKQALQTNTTGYQNTAGGAGALRFNTSGYGNTANGVFALNANITGYSNTAVGQNSLVSNNAGFENVAIGHNAAWSNDMGTQNTAVGSGALQYTQTGSGNTGVGFNAGQGLSNNSYANNALFGWESGFNLTTGSNNVLLGYNAGANLTSGANNLILGYNLSAASATGSNQLAIGGVLTGNTSTGALVFDGAITGGTLTADIIGTATTHGVCHSGIAGANENVQIVACTTPVGADYAELYPSQPDIKAGDIVMPTNVYATSKDGQFQVPVLAKTSGAYDANEIGVVSAIDPNSDESNLTGRNVNDSDHPMPIALNGRVMTSVNTQNGVIQPGDYITASSTPGVGMKATVAGEVIGRALQSYSGAGTGQVLVFVNPFYYSGPSLVSYIQNGGSAALSDLTVSGMADVSNLNVSSTATIANLRVQTLLVSGDLTVQGLIAVQDIQVGGHITTAGDAPVATVLAAAGEHAVVTISGNDTSGTITVTTGDPHKAATRTTAAVLAPTAGDLVQLTFAKQFGAAPRIMLSPTDKDSAPLLSYPSTTDDKGFVLGIVTQPSPQKTYKFNYWIVQ